MRLERSEHPVILTVSEITRAIKSVLEDEFPVVYVRGEVSNFKQHTSGHRYFTIKDAEAQIQCVLWRSRRLLFQLTDGMEVIVEGRLTVYARQGNYQIDCSRVIPAGKGDLYLAFEQLKQKLAAKGYFAEERKRPLPPFPHKIGIVTSISGAAIRDILTTLKRRMPLVEVLIRPTLVQGESAPQDIAQAIAELNQTDCDVIIVARGGGSIEDLWAFNTEIVAEAIYRSRIPVISAVGHEVDFTIADFVADRRAATPTAAAQVVVRDRTEVQQQLHAALRRLQAAVQSQLQLRKQRIEHLQHLLERRSPLHQIHEYAQYLDTLQMRLQSAMLRALNHRRQLIDRLAAHLRSLHPFAPLSKGYALLRSNGHYLAANEPLHPGDSIRIVRAQQIATATVEHVQPGDQADGIDENF